MRDTVTVTDAVSDTDAVIEPVRVTEAVRDTVMLIEFDIVLDGVAPNVSEPVDEGVCVDVTVLDGVVDTEILYEGDGAQKAGIVG